MILGQEVKPPLDEATLIHFGIKGMKWGFRKQRESSGDKSRVKTNEQKPNTHNEPPKKYFGLTKKQALIGAGVLVGIGVAAVVLHKTKGFPFANLEKGLANSTLGKGRLEELLTKHGKTSMESFPKGHIFTRFSRVAETEVRNGAYSVYTPKDVANYTVGWTSKHKIKIETLGDIKSPSLQTRFDTMADLVDKPIPEFADKTLRKHLLRIQSTRNSKAWVKRASAEDLGKYYYASVTGNVWEKNPVGKAYLARLREQGYDAMIDDRDTGGLAEAAMVLINKNMFQIKSNDAINRVDIDAAYEELKKLLSK